MSRDVWELPFNASPSIDPKKRDPRVNGPGMFRHPYVQHNTLQPKAEIATLRTVPCRIGFVVLFLLKSRNSQD